MRSRRRVITRHAGRGLLGMWFAAAGACAPHRAPSGLVAAPASGAPLPDAPVLRIPRDAARFEIDGVDDSTARFRPREAAWVRPGQRAYAVDPLHRDALVARLRVVTVSEGTAVALVTSQVTRVGTDHVMVLARPSVPWWRTRPFWIGSMLGVLAGGAIGASVSP